MSPSRDSKMMVRLSTSMAFSSPSRVLIEYYIQKTYDAEAVVDRAYVICADSGENANTERSTLG